jgi:hypothetical protein
MYTSYVDMLDSLLNKGNQEENKDQDEDLMTQATGGRWLKEDLNGEESKSG